MVRQSIRDKEKSALNKEMALANLDILRKHNEISQDEYEAALEELEAEQCCAASHDRRSSVNVVMFYPPGLG